MIWTNVIRTNIGRIKVNLIVGISSRYSLVTKSFIKIWLLTADIFLLWIDVARTNIARTNINWMYRI